MIIHFKVKYINIYRERKEEKKIKTMKERKILRIVTKLMKFLKQQTTTTTKKRLSPENILEMYLLKFKLNQTN
jgi:hypothetical protein